MVKILILGGGFGGIRCALDLEKRLKKEIKIGEAQVTVIDKNSYHLFVTNLYEIASATGIKKDPFSITLKKSVCLPYADIFNGKNINFVQAEIKEVDIKNKKVKTNGGNIHEYEYLVIALGSQSADFNIPGVGEYAYKFKNLEDALLVHDKIDSVMNDAANGQMDLPIDILVGGAGFTGIEVATELACCAKSIARKCGLKGRCSSIVLFEAGAKVLPMVSDKERKIIMERLTKHGVMVMENSPIEEVGNNFIKLKTGQNIKGDIIIWTAGTKPNEFIQSIEGLSLNDKNKIIVENTLLANSSKNIFAIGDNIEFVDPKTKKPVPAMAFVAIKEGQIAAKNILRSIKDKKLVVYKPAYNIWIAPTGGKYAVANLSGISIYGFWGWVVRELVDLRYMLQILPFFKAFSVFWEEVTLFTKND